MYDLTGMPDDNLIEVFDDWRMLRNKMHITEDPAYQHHKGKPLVAGGSASTIRSNRVPVSSRAEN
jgi:hypothetical protein